MTRPPAPAPRPTNPLTPDELATLARLTADLIAAQAAHDALDEDAPAYWEMVALQNAVNAYGSFATPERIARLVAAVRAGEATEKLAAFGAWALVAMRDDVGTDLDGGDAQEEAERLGLLATVRVAEPCGEHCRCAEYDDFPQDCLRYAPGISDAIAARATPSLSESHDNAES